MKGLSDVRNLIQPLPFLTRVNMDIGTVVLASLLLFVFMCTGRWYRLDRWKGALFLAGYIIYLAVIALTAKGLQNDVPFF